MLNSIKNLSGCRILATDGDAGRVRDVYLDDDGWTVRYLVVDPCKWLHKKHVLVLPSAVTSIDWNSRSIAVNLTRDQVDHGPDASSHEPVSSQLEAEHQIYSSVWAWGMPVLVPVDPEFHVREPDPTSLASGDAHLRSSRVVRGYHIRAADDSIGHVDDFLFDDQTWAIRYLIADTRNWLPGKHVLISPKRVKDVSWSDREFRVDLSRRQIERSPEFNAAYLSA